MKQKEAVIQFMGEDYIRHCMDNLKTYYQDIVDVDGNTAKRELLTRLPYGVYDGGIEAFFDKISAKDSMSISLNQIEMAAKIYEKTKIVCSVNVDNYAWFDEELRSQLIEKCRLHSLPIVLEVTELRPLPPASETNSVFLELKRQGAHIALDDFGTGFNGMSVFAEYDFDIVKIDRQLTLGLEERPQKLKVLAHVLNLLNALGKDHVVEGVEDSKQLKNLTDIGFSVFQGFLFHKPAPIEGIL